jgi:hypothetical protein
MSFESSNSARYTQGSIFDRFDSLSEKARKWILNSKYATFHTDIYPNIDVDSYQVLYTDKGRSPTTVRDMVMALILQSEENLTVDSLIFRMNTDIAFQYVFGLTGYQMECPISRSNYFAFLARLDQYEEETGINLIKQTVKRLSVRIGKELGYDLEKALDGVRIKARMDSMLIESFSKRFPRAGIIYRCNYGALNLYARLEGKAGIPSNLLHYFEEDDMNRQIYHLQKSQTSRLTALLEESIQIRDLMPEDDWKEFAEYKNLSRAIGDQGSIQDDGSVIPKENKEIKGTSLQSPYAPETTARTKNHKTTVGDAVNFVELYGNGASIILDGDIKPSIYADQSFSKDIIDAKDPETAEIEMTVDGAYFTVELMYEAAEKGIILLPTALTGTQTNPLFSEFNLSEDGRTLLTCPNQVEAIEQRFDENHGVIIARFDKAACASCPFAAQCPCHRQVKSNVVRISHETVDRAEVQSSLGSDEHTRVAHARNGVEAIPSIMRRKYDIDHFRSNRTPIRKLKLFGAIMCYNCQKLTSFRRRQGVTMPICSLAA